MTGKTTTKAVFGGGDSLTRYKKRTITTITERPRVEPRVPPGLPIPEIENNLTRREFLTGAGSLLGHLEELGLLERT